MAGLFMALVLWVTFQFLTKCFSKFGIAHLSLPSGGDRQSQRLQGGFTLSGANPKGGLLGHKGSQSLMAPNDSFALEFVVGPLDGDQADQQLPGQGAE
jgi:hypothetical protein